MCVCVCVRVCVFITDKIDTNKTHVNKPSHTSG